MGQGWNTYHVPTQKQQTPVDSLVPFETQLKYLKPLSNSKAFSPKKFDYFVIVFWNRFMGRQSKRLVHFVQENVNYLK